MSPDVEAPGRAAPRPTRAELRRQREAPSQPVPPPAVPVTAAVGRAGRREQLAAANRRDNPVVSLLKAWWFYPLLALIALCVVLGWRSTQTPQVPPGVQVSTPAPEN